MLGRFQVDSAGIVLHSCDKRRRLCRRLKHAATKSQQSRNAAPMSGNASIPVIGPALLACAQPCILRAELTR
jgi:hypothetical protein